MPGFLFLRSRSMEKPKDEIYENIPSITRENLDEYVKRGRYPGGFLEAVLTNDLFGAFGRADTGNLEAIPLLVKYIYNRCPHLCWGSKEKMEQWMDHGGALGEGE
jgi:hypothetical protein